MLLNHRLLLFADIYLPLFITIFHTMHHADRLWIFLLAWFRLQINFRT